MKPVGLVAYPIQNSCMSNCIVLDPFGGSGSTLIACEQTSRICYMAELDEKFVDVIVQRYMEQKGSAEDVSVIQLMAGFGENAEGRGGLNLCNPAPWKPPPLQT